MAESSSSPALGKTLPFSVDAVRRLFALAVTADECVELSAAAEEAGDLELANQCLEKAIRIDRRCQPAYLMLAAQALDSGDQPMTAALLEEASRCATLPPEIDATLQQLMVALSNNQQLRDFRRFTGRIGREQSATSLSIVVITNLLPPQELGGYGRMMWEFARGLQLRGHRIRVLTSDSVEFSKPASTEETEFETCVSRKLELCGTWIGGKATLLSDEREVMRRLRDNAARVRTAVAKMRADLVLVGNIDLLGGSILRPSLDAGIATLHALANATPGYRVEDQPQEPHYWVAPCSNWNGDVLAQRGFAPPRVETLYPGACIDRFFHLFLPDVSRLRICYASLVLPYKGAHTLITALLELHRAGVEFQAEIAGDAPNRDFLSDLKAAVSAAGANDKIRFTGFLDRHGLAALFARSNVLVFPSEFDEPFGISQVEALAAGLVVVSSGTGGAREIVRDGVDGLLFERGNANELAAKLRKLAEDQDEFRRLQHNAQPRALEFSVDRAVERIEVLAARMHEAIEAANTDILVDVPAF